MSKYNKHKNGNNSSVPKFRSPWGVNAPTLKFQRPERVELDVAIFFRPEEFFVDPDGDAHNFVPLAEEPVMGAMLVAPMKNSSGAAADIYPVRLRPLVVGERGEVKGKPTIETVEVAVAVCPHCGRVLVDGDKLADCGVSRKEARNVKTALSAYGHCPECGDSSISVEEASDADLAEFFGYRVVVQCTGGDQVSAGNILPKEKIDATWFKTLDEAKEAIAQAKKDVENASTLGIKVCGEDAEGLSFSVCHDESLVPPADPPAPEKWFEASVAIVSQTKIWRQEFDTANFPASAPALPEFIVGTRSLSEAWPQYHAAIKDPDVAKVLDELQNDECWPVLIDSLPIAMATKKDDKGRSPEIDPTKFYFLDVDNGGDYATAGWYAHAQTTGRLLVEQFPIMDNTSNTPKFLFINKNKYASRTVTFK